MVVRGGVGGRPARLGGYLGGLLCGFDGVDCHCVAEGLELALEASGAVRDRVALALPARAEVTEWDLVADDVVVGDEEVVADSADGFLFPAPTAELGVVGGEIGFFGADCGAGALGELGCQPAGSGASPPGASVAR